MEVTTDVQTLGRGQCLITNNGPDDLLVGESGQDTDNWYTLESGTAVAVKGFNNQIGVVSVGVSDVGVLFGGTGVFPPAVDLGDVDLSGVQPLDSDLTAIAALTTTSYGRALLTLVNAAAADWVPNSLFDANTMLVAHTDNTPVAVTIATNQVAGRGNSGNIKGLSPAETVAIIGTEVFTQPQAFNPQTGTTYTLVAGDAGKNVTLSNASAITLTVPQDSAATIAIGSYIDLYQLGAGQVTVVAGTGATLRVSGLTAKARAQYSRLGLQKVSANTWSLFGDLALS